MENRDIKLSSKGSKSDVQIRNLPGKKNAFIDTQAPSEVIGTAEQLQLVEDWFEGVPSCSRHLWCWILDTTLRNAPRGIRTISIPAEEMVRQIQDCPTRTKYVWKEIPGSVLHVDPEYEFYREKKGTCRRFRIPSDVLETFVLAGGGGELYDLCSGNPRKEPANKTRVSKPNNHHWKSPLGDALEVIRDTRSLINFTAAKQYLAEQKKKLKQAERSSSQEEVQEIRCRLINDLTCWNAICNQDLREEEQMPDGIYSYDPAYKVQRQSGRVSEIRGGAQSCSTELKAALRKGIPGLINFDIKSSHHCLLMERMRDAGLDCEKMEDIDQCGKEQKAERLGISVDAFKKVYYATFYGAKVYDNLSDAERVEGPLPSIPSVIREEANRQGEDQNDLYKRVKTMLRPIQQSVDKYVEYRLSDYFEQNKGYSPKREAYYIRNEAGVPFYPSDYEEGWDRRVATLTHVLQGDEAAFIHSITKQSEEYDYSVQGNEHDGILVRDSIPEEVKDNAREASGFHSAVLEEKPLNG